MWSPAHEGEFPACVLGRTGLGRRRFVRPRRYEAFLVILSFPSFDQHLGFPMRWNPYQTRVSTFSYLSVTIHIRELGSVIQGKEIKSRALWSSG